MEYGSSCWSPTNNKLINELERVHHNAAKFVSNFYPKKGNYENFSISKLMKNLNWSTLEQRRQEARITMAFKILKGHVILDPQMLPKLSYQRPLRKCNNVKVGPENQLIEPDSRLDVTSHTFFYSAPKLWNNNVTPVQANSPSVDAFKSHFNK